MFIIIGAATLMLPIAIFALLGLSGLMFANDVTDDDDTREPAPDENPDTTPVDSIYDEPEIDPETGALLVAPSQVVQGTDEGDVFNLVEGADYYGDYDSEANQYTGAVTVDAGAGDDVIDFDEPTGNLAGDFFIIDSALNGGAGNDAIDAFGQDLSITGDEGDDTLYIRGGSSYLFGGAGDDTLRGDVVSTDASAFYGGSGDDTLDARGMDNVALYGEAGNDTILTSEHGPDGTGYVVRADGGEGDDRLIHEAPEQGWSSGRPTLIGGEGSDSFEVTIVDCASDPTNSDPMPGDIEQSDVVILGDFDRDEDTLQITLNVSDPGYSVTSAEIVEQPYPTGVVASGTPVYATESRINVTYEHDTENDRQMTIVVRGDTGLTWDDVTFVGDHQPPVLQPLV